MKLTIPVQNDQIHGKSLKPFYITHPEIIIYALLIIINFITYLPVLNFDFVWDDHHYITRNHHIQSGLTSKGIIWAFKIQNNSTYWHPLAFISHMLDIQFFGLNPIGHHLSSILIHTVNSLLLFYVFRLMTGSLWRSAFVAALFAIHPVNIESVAWIAERKNVLSTFFWLLTILTYYWYTQKKSFKRYFLTCIVFGLGLLTKPMLVTLPLILLLLDFWPLNRYEAKTKADNSNKNNPNLFSKFFSSRFIKLAIEKTPLLILSYLVYLVTTMSLYSAVHNIDIFVTNRSIPISLRISNAFVSYIKYIMKLIWPVNLACFYPFPESIPLWQVLGSAFFLILATLFFVKLFRKRPYYLVGWLWFCITLLPVSGLIQAGRWPEMADRWAYVPYMGLFIIVAWGILDIEKKKNYLRIFIIFSLIIISNMAVTKYNLQFWENGISLFSHAVNVTKNNENMKVNLSRGYTNQGRQLQLAGKLDAAEQKFIDAIVIFPGNKLGYNALGINCRLKGDSEGALTNFKRALEIDPDFAIAHMNTGLILLENNKIEESIFHLQEAVRLDPRDVEAKEKLSEALLMANKIIPMN